MSRQLEGGKTRTVGLAAKTMGGVAFLVPPCRPVLMRLLFLVCLLIGARAALAQSLPENGAVVGTLSAASDTLDSGEFVASYELVVTSGEAFEVALTSDDFDTFLVMRSPGGEQRSNDDWEGSQGESRVRVERGEPGRWRVFVTTYAPGEEGAFEVAHQTVDAVAMTEDQAREKANALSRDVLALYQTGNYVAALDLARQAVALQERVFGLNHPRVGVSLVNLGALHEALGEYASARSALERALAILRPALGEDHLDVATALNNVASIHLAEGNPGEAQPLLEEALAIRERAQGSDHPEVAKTLNNLAMAAEGQGDYATAQSLHERALHIREAALGPDHPDVAVSLNNLSNVLVLQGAYAEAKAAYERALTIREDQLGATHPLTAQSLDNLAGWHKARGQYGVARPLLERALEAREATFGAEHPEVAVSLGNLAELLHSQGDYAAAHPLYERALSVREAVFGPDHPSVAGALLNLGALYEDQGDHAAAYALYERSIAIREATLGASHPGVASALSNLGVLLERAGDHAAAQSVLERALQIREGALDPEHPDLATSLNNLAVTLQSQKAYDEARALYGRALAIWEASLGAEHPQVGVALGNLAMLAEEEGRGDAAHPFHMRAARLFDAHVERTLPSLSAAEQRAFIGSELKGATSVLLSRRTDADTTAMAYRIVGGWKGLLLRGLRQQTAIAHLASDPDHAADVAELRRVRTHVARAYREGGADLAPLTEEKEALERRLMGALPSDAVQDVWRTSGFDGLRASLPRGGAFVDIYRYSHVERGQFIENRYAAIVTAVGIALTQVDLGAANDIEQALAAWREAATTGREAPLEALADSLWAPIARALPDATTQVWLSPDGDLSRAPWSALASATDGPLVAQVPSARALMTLLSADRQLEGSPTALLVGGVDFGEGSAWAPLPGTEAEVEALSELADGVGLATRVLAGDEPTAAAVTDALAGAAFVHLATHGFFFGESPAALASSRQGLDLEFDDADAGVRAVSRSPLAESGLALAGANAGPGGSLTAEELVGLDLSATRLVVLSACETGRGTEVTGQGVLGLQASLTAAGAGAVLMSLWAVPDASTAALMEAFYRELWQEGRSPAEALELAQAEVRATPGWAAPVHWAAWVLTGDAFSSVR